MPSRAVTVYLNYDHNKKFVHLPPQEAREQTPKEAVLREARNKFRNKGLSTVYLRGGIILEDTYPSFPESVTQLWVGKGEPYSGPPLDNSHASNIGQIRVISQKSFVDETAINQLKSVRALPGVHIAVGMPDLHPGNRFPIGCAIASEGVYPALIGSDVGCGIAVYELSNAATKLSGNPAKLARLITGMDDPWSGSVSDWLAKYGIQRSSSFDLPSLGTIGAGNHFAEICTLERIVDPDATGSLHLVEGALYLLVHTGSRGLGASILASQTVNKSNPYIAPDSPELEAYLVEHDYAVQWAIANRDLVAHRIKECIYPESEPESPGLRKLIDVTHNSVTRHELQNSEGGVAQLLWVHRKGAAPADKGIVPCPGSRGGFSWLLQPTGDGQLNIQSLAHGAGRRHGRNAMHGGTKIAKSSLTTTSLGSAVICTDPNLLLEERPEAYKDVGCVVEDMEEHGICSGVAVFRPVVTYKTRQGEDGVHQI